MFQDVFVLVASFLGSYVGQDGSKRPAISQDYAISGEVKGLEVVVGSPTYEEERYTGGARSRVTSYSIYLTQWGMSGRNTIRSAVEALVKSDLGYSIRAEPILLGNGENIVRYVVSVETNCIC